MSLRCATHARLLSLLCGAVQLILSIGLSHDLEIAVLGPYQAASGLNLRSE